MKANKIVIGQIIGTFGIKGELKVYSESDFVEYRFRKGAKIIINDEVYTISSSRFHKGNVLITINEFYNINQVLDKVGMKITTIDDEIPPLNENEYYVDQLIGLTLYNTLNECLGKVSDVIEIPSGYLLEIEGEQNKKFLVPFVDAFVKEIDEEKIVIEEIEGLR